jgi:K+-transporting ATPase KdpF subunit
MDFAIWLPVTFGLGLGGLVLCSYSCLGARRSREVSVIYLTAAVAAFAFGYLLAALVRPERF